MKTGVLSCDHVSVGPGRVLPSPAQLPGLQRTAGAVGLGQQLRRQREARRLPASWSEAASAAPASPMKAWKPSHASRITPAHLDALVLGVHVAAGILGGEGVQLHKGAGWVERQMSAATGPAQGPWRASSGHTPASAITSRQFSTACACTPTHLLGVLEHLDRLQVGSQMPQPTVAAEPPFYPHTIVSLNLCTYHTPTCLACLSALSAQAGLSERSSSLAVASAAGQKEGREA